MIAMGALVEAWNVGHIRGDQSGPDGRHPGAGQKDLFFDLASATADVDLALVSFSLSLRENAAVNMQNHLRSQPAYKSLHDRKLDAYLLDAAGLPQEKDCCP